MRKGFIFSLDAAFAISVLIVATAFVYVTTTNVEQTQPYESMKIAAHDDAITEFYRGLSTGQSINFDKRFGYCARYFSYNPDNLENGPDDPETIKMQKYCREDVP